MVLNLFLFIYLIYIQVLPITHDVNQLVLLGGVLLFAVLRCLVNKDILTNLKSNKVGITLFAALIVNSIFFTTLGFLNSQPGAEEYLLVTIVVPLIYMFIFCLGGSNNKKLLKIINLSFVISTTIIGIFFLLQLLNFIGISDFVVKLAEEEENQRVAFVEGKGIVGLRFIPLYSLTYLFPINFFILLNSFLPNSSAIRKVKNFNLGFKGLLVFNVVTSLACVFLSGRQGILVGFLVSIPVSLFAFTKRNPKKYSLVKLLKKFAPPLIICIVLISSVNYSPDYFKLDGEYFASFLERNSEDVERIGQFHALVESWVKSPIIGHGNGSVVSWVRSEERPWRYELSYILMLTNTGIIGIFIYTTSLCIICYSLFTRFRKTGDIIYLSSMAGLISLIVADASNPYMIRFTVSYYLYYCLYLVIINRNDSQLLHGYSKIKAQALQMENETC